MAGWTRGEDLMRQRFAYIAILTSHPAPSALALQGWKRRWCTLNEATFKYYRSNSVS